MENEELEDLDDGKKKRGKTVFLIGDLDTNTRLVSSTHSINIEIKKEIEDRVTGEKKATWAAKFFYPDVKSAFYGYLKYKSKNPVDLRNMGLKAILEYVEKLYALVDDTGTRLEALWSKNVRDVVQELRDGGEES